MRSSGYFVQGVLTPAAIAARALRYAGCIHRCVFTSSVLTLLALGIALAAPQAHAEVAVGTRSISHGVKAWYAQNDAVPVVDVVISFEGAGSASDPAGKAGRAAFVAAMLTEGAGNRDSAAFRRALEEKAITLEVKAEEDRLHIHLYCLREHVGSAGELLAAALTQPLLAEADQARMKADLTSAIARMNEQPSYHAQRLLQQRAFAGHPYANPPYGDAASIAGLHTQDVRDYMNTYMTRGNVLIAASGDVDSGVLDHLLEPLVDALNSNDAAGIAISKTTLQGGGDVVRETMKTPQTTILFAAPAIAREDSRFYAAYLLNHILGGNTLFSRLGEQVRKRKGLVYGIQSELDTKRGISLLSGALATRNATAEEALGEVKAVFEDIHSKGVTTQECTDAKSYVQGAFARQLDSNQAVANMLLTMQIYKLGEDYINERDGLFNKVSCAEINSVASELLSPSRFLFAVVGGKVEAGDVKPAAPAAVDTPK